MKRLKALAISALSMGLIGCDAMFSNALSHNYDLTLPAGYKILVNEQPVSIQGFDLCPDESVAKSSCIHISKERSAVSVEVSLPDGPVIEVWEISREIVPMGNVTAVRTRLIRPDGQVVVPSLNQR